MRLEYSNRKQNKINYEVQFLTNSVLKDKIKKKSIEKSIEKTKSGRLGLTC